MLISFSGLDGAGKTTLIAKAKEILERGGRKVKIMTMYDNVSFSAFLRNRVIRRNKNFRNPSVRSDGQSYRLDKNRQDSRTVSLRQLVYVVDLIIFLSLRVYYQRIKKNTLIMDRYFYDSLANVAAVNKLAWLYTRFFLLVAPEPDIPVLVDVSAEEAFSRKHEYPLEYMRNRRDTYHRIFGLLSKPIVIKNHDLSEAQYSLEKVLSSKLIG